MRHEPIANETMRNPNLTDEEIDNIVSDITAEAVLSEAWRAVILSLLVDGVERATLDLSKSCTARVAVPEDAETLEVRAHDTEGELLLACYVLSYSYEASPDAARPVSIVLEGGQKLSFTSLASAP